MRFGRTLVRVAGVVTIAFCCAAFSGGLAIGQDTVPNSVVAGGGGTVSAGNFTLHYTIGEPAAGPISAGSTTLISGFQATIKSLKATWRASILGKA